MTKYVELKKQEYFKEIAIKLRLLKELTNSRNIIDTTVDEIADILGNEKLSELEKRKLKAFPDKLDKILDKKINRTSKNISKSKYTSLLKAIWKDLYNLGVKHSNFDELENLKLLKKRMSDPKLYTTSSRLDTLFDQISFSDHVISQANFADDDKGIKYRKKLERDLKLKVALNNKKIAELDRKQKIEYLKAVNRISNNARKANVMRDDYLSEYYIQERFRVLTEEYSLAQDTQVRQAVYKFLKSNPSTIEGLTSKKLSIAAYKTQIKQAVSTDILSSNNMLAESKASRILRTEANLAYNFGKIAAFHDNMNYDVLFQWSIDFEMQASNPDYKICKACFAMNGKVFSVRELMQVGVLTNDGILKYNGSNRTTWKSPRYPIIPFHPNCLTADTSIMCKNGTIKCIKDIKINDYIYVPTFNQYRRVTKTFKNWHSKEIIRLCCSDGSIINITNNHPVWTNSGWIDAGKLKEGQELYKNNRNSLSVWKSDQTIIPRQFKIYKRIRTSFKKLLGLSLFQQNNYENFEIFKDKQIKKTDTSEKKSIFGIKTKQFQKNETQQSYARRRNKTKSYKQSIKKWFTKSSLQIKNWKRVLQNGIQRRYTTLLQKFMGSKYSQNIKPLQNKMGVRKSNRVDKWKQIIDRLLYTSTRLLHRSKGLLDKRLCSKMGTIQQGLSSTPKNFNREKPLQGTNIDTSKLTPIRITKIEKYIEPQYVYNLSVEGDEMYFANGILVHNCSCYWTVHRGDGTVEKLLKPKDAQEFLGTLRNVIPKVIGAGLLVTGGFLLARSTVFRGISKQMTKQLSESFSNPLKFMDQVDDAVKFIDDFIDEEEVTTFKQVIINIVNEADELDIKVSDGISQDVIDYINKNKEEILNTLAEEV